MTITERSAGSVAAATENIGLLLSLASAKGVVAANAALTEVELSTRSYSLLDVVAQTGGLSQREIADAIRLDPSQIVALLDSLEGRGLLERRTNPDDRRQRSVVATPAGHTLLRRARTLVDASLDEVLVALDQTERDQLRGLLRRVVRADVATDVAALVQAR